MLSSDKCYANAAQANTINYFADKNNNSTILMPVQSANYENVLHYPNQMYSSYPYGMLNQSCINNTYMNSNECIYAYMNQSTVPSISCGYQNQQGAYNLINNMGYLTPSKQTNQLVSIIEQPLGPAVTAEMGTNSTVSKSIKKANAKEDNRQKPDESYAEIVFKAILSSNEKMMQLKDIYYYISSK
jgi:hypothetical protein